MSGILLSWPTVARMLSWPLICRHPELADKDCAFTPCAEGLLVEPVTDTAPIPEKRMVPLSSSKW